MTATQNKGGVPKAMTADELYDKISSEGGFDEDTMSKIKAMIPEETEAPASETNEEDAPPPASKRSGGSPASFAQLEEVVPAELADRDSLIVAMQREGVTVSAAQARVQGAVLKQLKALSEKNAAADATAGQTAPYSAGRAPVKGGNRGGSAPAGNAVQRWNAAVSAVMETGKKRSEAVAAVVRSNPELHRAYLDEVNAGRAE
jgi:hypothetical protein